MADTDADGAVIPADRHNKLVGHYQRALSMLTPEQRETLKAERPEAPGFNEQTGEQSDSRQTFEPGSMFEADEAGNLVPYEPPTPRVHNEAVRRNYQPRDDGSAKSAWAQLAATIGASDDDGSW